MCDVALESSRQLIECTPDAVWRQNRLPLRVALADKGALNSAAVP